MWSCVVSTVVQENPLPLFSAKRKENYTEGVEWFLFTSVDGVMEKRNNKYKKKKIVNLCCQTDWSLPCVAGSGAVTSSSCSSATSALRLLLTLETSLHGQGGCTAGDALKFPPQSCCCSF